MPSKNSVIKYFLILLCINGSISEEIKRKSCSQESQSSGRTDTSEQIKKLREEMHTVRSVSGPALDAYIVTRYDEHMNDYVSDHDKRLQYITGYTGNYGFAIITKNEMAFWTDELHYVQADNELSCNWTLFKIDLKSILTKKEEVVRNRTEELRKTNWNEFVLNMKGYIEYDQSYIRHRIRDMTENLILNNIVMDQFGMLCTVQRHSLYTEISSDSVAAHMAHAVFVTFSTTVDKFTFEFPDINDRKIVVMAADWLTHELQSGMRVGVDPKLMPNSEYELMSKMLMPATRSITLIPVVQNLVDLIWPEEIRMPLMNKTAFVWPDQYAGRTWKEKLNATRENLKILDMDAMVLTSLSEIAWLLNIRAYDLPYGPFLKAYVIVTKDQLHLYTATGKLTEEIHTHLYTNSCVSAYCTRLHEYETIWNDLRKLSQQWKKVLLPSMSHYTAGVSRQIYISVALEKRKPLPSPLINMMAEKNEIEKEGMRNAHIQDAIMFCNFSAYLHSEIDSSLKNVDEMQLTDLINTFRLDEITSRSISYPSVVASGANTVIPTYVSRNATNRRIESNKPLIIDSGAHYWGGTTALARTFILEKTAINEMHIELYTRILAGLINMATLSFPSYLSVSQLDIIARTPLWNVGLDYPQGSGHGIGVFSNIYESPIDIDYRNGQNNTLKEGYFFVAETAFYLEQEFGMKLSCVFEVVYKKDSPGYLSFQPVTLFPFEHKMINYTMLSIEQKIWLNEYNAKIKTIVGGKLFDGGYTSADAYNWLVDQLDKIPLVDTENGSTKLNDGSILKYFVFMLIVHCIVIV